MTERNYKQEDLLKAIEAVNQGATTSDAARKFKVPRTTLNDKIKGLSLVGCSKGPTTVLTPEEEEQFTLRTDYKSLRLLLDILLLGLNA